MHFESEIESRFNSDENWFQFLTRFKNLITTYQSKKVNSTL